jgi:hypothetical protein
MPLPGDLCILQALKLYMGGASPVDAGNDSLLGSLITAASAFIARYLDRDLLSLGGQGLSAIAAMGSDSGGSFVALAAQLPVVSPAGASVIDLTSGALTTIVTPTNAMTNSLSRLYLSSNVSLAVGDPVSVAFINTYVETYDGSGKRWQWVRQWPISKLIAVTDLTSGFAYPLNMISADAELPRISFVTPAPGSTTQIVFPNGSILGQIFNRGSQNLQVSYSAGYPTAPADLAQAACELALLWFRNRDRIGVSSEAILGSHVNFLSTSDLLPQTKMKLDLYKRTMRGY